MRGLSQVRGPPSGTPQNPLAQRLEDENFRFENGCNVHADCGGHNGLALINHIIQYKTPSNVTKMIWSHRRSTLRHESVMFRVSIPEDNKFSWLRIERLGDIAGSANPRKRSAGLVITLAADQEELEEEGDEQIAQVEFNGTKGCHRCRVLPTLVDLARLIKIIHNEMPDYTLFRFSCWWFARMLFKSLVTEFHDGDDKLPLLETCKIRESYHIGAPHKPITEWVGIGSGVTMAVLSCLGVHGALAIVGMWTTNGAYGLACLANDARTRYYLKKSEKSIRYKVSQYIVNS